VASAYALFRTLRLNDNNKAILLLLSKANEIPEEHVFHVFVCDAIFIFRSHTNNTYRHNRIHTLHSVRSIHICLKSSKPNLPERSNCTRIQVKPLRVSSYHNSNTDGETLTKVTELVCSKNDITFSRSICSAESLVMDERNVYEHYLLHLLTSFNTSPKVLTWPYMIWHDNTIYTIHFDSGKVMSCCVKRVEAHRMRRAHSMTLTASNSSANVYLWTIRLLYRLIHYFKITMPLLSPKNVIRHS